MISTDVRICHRYILWSSPRIIVSQCGWSFPGMDGDGDRAKTVDLVVNIFLGILYWGKVSRGDTGVHTGAVTVPDRGETRVLHSHNLKIRHFMSWRHFFA